MTEEKSARKSKKRAKEKKEARTNNGVKSKKREKKNYNYSDRDMEERRKSKRYPTEIEVRYSSEQGLAVEWITNISKGGMFIKSENPLPPGTPLKITFSVPGREDLSIEVEGVVKWRAEPSDPSIIPGMGVEITKIDDRNRKLFEELIESLTKKQNQRTA